MPLSYLLNLHERVAGGLGRLPAEFRKRHAAYLARRQNADGGFSGREGPSDLYYTGFALRSLAALGALTPPMADKAAGFLTAQLRSQASVVDFFSFLYSCFLAQAGGGPEVLAGSAADRPERVAQTLETFRTPDHGYAKAAGAASGSTYHTFLVTLCYQMLVKDVPDADKVVGFIRTRQRDDGGFVEIAPMRRSGTNPTAAAVGVLQILAGDLESAERERIVAFLAGMPSMEGGFRANDRAPLADLLSTFTGAWTLAQLDALDPARAEEALRYARSLELKAGGFRGGLWDEHTDVEYTFYGLGCMAVLHK
jgi:geranylgeranyl transferase type-2 subunit beta